MGSAILDWAQQRQTSRCTPTLSNIRHVDSSSPCSSRGPAPAVIAVHQESVSCSLEGPPHREHREHPLTASRAASLGRSSRRVPTEGVKEGGSTAGVPPPNGEAIDSRLQFSVAPVAQPDTSKRPRGAADSGGQEEAVMKTANI